MLAFVIHCATYLAEEWFLFSASLCALKTEIYIAWRVVIFSTRTFLLLFSLVAVIVLFQAFLRVFMLEIMLKYFKTDLMELYWFTWAFLNMVKEKENGRKKKCKSSHLFSKELFDFCDVKIQHERDIVKKAWQLKCLQKQLFFYVRQYLLWDDWMGEKRIDAYFDIIQM